MDSCKLNFRLFRVKKIKMKQDIEIAQEAKIKPIEEIAALLGIGRDDLEFYGKYKAKFHWFPFVNCGV